MNKEFAIRLCHASLPTMSRGHTSAIRHYIDSVICCCVLKYPDPLVGDILVPCLRAYNAVKQSFTSSVLIGTHCVGVFASRRDNDESCAAIVREILPWSLSSYGSVRAMAHHAVLTGRALLAETGDVGVATVANGFSRFLEQSDKAGRVHSQLVRPCFPPVLVCPRGFTPYLSSLQLEELAVFDPFNACTLQSILRSQPDENGDLIPASACDAVSWRSVVLLGGAHIPRHVCVDYSTHQLMHGALSR